MAVALLAVSSVWAEEETAPAPVAAVPKWYERVTVGGFIDTSYQFRFQGDSLASNVARVFDIEPNTFLVNYAEVNLTLPAEPAGFRLDLGFGPVADLTSFEARNLAYGNLPQPAGAGLGSANQVVKYVQQAYGSFKLDVHKGLTFDVGRFATSAGAEVVESKDNVMYTRAVMFGYGLPVSHTGVRLTMPLTDSLTLQLAGANGWDVVFDNNRGKTGNISLFLNLAATAMAFNFYFGPEVSGDDSTMRFLLDLVVTQKLLEDKLVLVLNCNYAGEGDTSWYSGLLALKASVSDSVRVVARGEYFGDPQGVRLLTGPRSIVALTAGVNFSFGSNVELRLEGRHDIALGDANIIFPGASTGQTTVTAALLAWF